MSFLLLLLSDPAAADPCPGFTATTTATYCTFTAASGGENAKWVCDLRGLGSTAQEAYMVAHYDGSNQHRYAFWGGDASGSATYCESLNFDADDPDGDLEVFLYGTNGDDRLYFQYTESGTTYRLEPFNETDAVTGRMFGFAGDDDMLGSNWAVVEIVADDEYLDVLSGGAGDDIIDGDLGPDVIKGGDDDDDLYGGDGADIIIDGSGEDDLYGGSQADVLCTTDDSDSDSAFGEVGDDTIWLGDSGTDSATGGAGSDLCSASGVGCEDTSLAAMPSECGQ